MIVRVYEGLHTQTYLEAVQHKTTLLSSTEQLKQSWIKEKFKNEFSLQHDLHFNRRAELILASV